MEKTREEIQKLIDSEKTLFEENQILRESLEREHTEYLRVINSKSWKITKPLRWIIEKIKKK